MRPDLGQLIERTAQEGPLAIPGADNPFTAKLVEAEGFPVLYMTGMGTAATIYGLPDVGLLTLTEMVFNAGNIARAVDIPVIADADNGYGNAVNAIRTVREYERAGVAAIQIEDQAFPKKCGHMDDKVLISCEEMVGKVRAAVAARGRGGHADRRPYGRARRHRPRRRAAACRGLRGRGGRRRVPRGARGRGRVRSRRR